MELNEFQVVTNTSHMHANKYNFNSSTPPSRLERLLRERELRRFNRSLQNIEESTDANIESGPLGNELCLSDGDNCGYFHDDELFEGFNNTVRNENERKEKQLTKQRLLVVANRLPVSAVRKGEDSWSLDISVGGLVSALLGKYLLLYVLFKITHVVKVAT